MTIPNAAEMLININQSIPELMRLTTALAYVGGTFMMVMNIAAMRNAPFLSSPGQGQQSMWALLKKIFVGAGLIYLPSVIHVGTSTFWADESPLSYITTSNVDIFSGVLLAARSIIYLIGTISVIKGLYELADGGQTKSEDGTVHSATKKGIIHMIGGILCINLPLTLQVIFSTLGINF